MLGVADYHKGIPRDHRGNVDWRKQVLLEAGGKTFTPNQTVVEHHKQLCKADILYYINGFVIQFNPNFGEYSREVGPFITWPEQEEAVGKILAAIQDRRDLLVEKSRDMGISWLCLLIMEWFAHFHQHKKFLCISRNEEAVESADPDSLFWKLDFLHQHLPPWLMPQLRRKKRFFGFLETHSAITGQATTGRAGVGGRATAMFIDEFSQIDEDYEVNRRTTDTTGCRIFNGTHTGPDTCFAKLADNAEVLGTPRKLVMHWTQHPDKRKGLYQFNDETGQIEVLDKQFAYPPDFQYRMTTEPNGGPFPGLRSPWYDEQCDRKGDRRAVAQDLDIDKTGSVSAFFDARTLARLKREYCCPPFWEGDVHYDPDSGKLLGLIPLAGGPLKLWIYPRPNGTLPEDDYGLGGDISSGVGSTNSCFSGVRSSGEKILEYAVCTIKPEALAPIAYALGHLLRNQHGEPAYFGWEHHGPGQVFGNKVVELGYARYLTRDSAPGVGNRMRPEKLPGWYPSNDAKRALLEAYRGALEKRDYINHSESALNDCKQYKYTASGNVEHPHDAGGEDPTGARVNHGDRAIADALSYRMLRELTGGRKKSADGGTEVVKQGSLAWRRQLAENERKPEEAWV